jgi:hypothetical protein
MDTGKPSLWAGIIGAPLVWLTQFLILYALVPWVCHSRKFFTLHLTVALAAILVAAALVLCYRDWQQVARQIPESTDGQRLGTARLTASVGLLNTSLILLIIIAQGIALFFIDPCAH